VFAILGAKQRVFNARGRVTGGLDDDVYLITLDHSLGVIDECGRGDARLIPADLFTARHGLGGIEIGDYSDHESGRGWRLRQKHRAEFAGAYQSNPHRLIIGFALLER